jgi:AraC-like DNA-binding protein
MLPCRRFFLYALFRKYCPFFRIFFFNPVAFPLKRICMSIHFPSPPRAVVRRIAQSFHKATGLPLQFHQGGEFHVMDDATVPPFCRLMAKGSNSCVRCVEFHLSLQQGQKLEPQSAVCFSGLTSSAVPVRQGEKLLGFLHTGHASVERSARCAEPGRSCRLPGRGKSSRCAGACQRTLEISQDRYEGAVELLTHLAERVASAPELTLSETNYPAVDRAMALLRADVTRDWTLSGMARQVGMHPGYFSERFHQHAGVTFGKFLAGLRLERARHLLEFTSLPVSEVAFASGFRSISQFNRTFKNHTGKSPGTMFPRRQTIP